VLKIAIVPKGFEEAAKMLENIDKGFPKAAAEAINRGLIAGRKVATKGITGRYNIRSSDVKGEGMYIAKASWGNIKGALESKGSMLPVSLFSPAARFSNINGSKRQLVKVTIIKGNRKLVKGAFMTKSGRVMERRQKSRYPIFPVSTIGVPFMLGQLGISSNVQKTIETVTAARLEHNVELFLSEGGRKIAASIGSSTRL
jgi:Prophage minor tail protein Z (GPZ)